MLWVFTYYSYKKSQNSTPVYKIIHSVTSRTQYKEVKGQIRFLLPTYVSVLVLVKLYSFMDIMVGKIFIILTIIFNMHFLSPEIKNSANQKI